MVKYAEKCTALKHLYLNALFWFFLWGD